MFYNTNIHIIDYKICYITGVMNMFGAIPGFIGTYISGAILEATGNWEYMYAVTGWVIITGWAIFAYWGSAQPISS